jgi:hypothetical protein
VRLEDLLSSHPAGSDLECVDAVRIVRFERHGVAMDGSALFTCPH